MSYIYEKNGAKIYRKSFSIIRKETDLSNFNKLEEKVVVRMVHASGMTSISSQIYFSPNMVSIARHAIENGANILCDTNMIKYGITISRMPAKNKIMCMIKDDQIVKISKEIKIGSSFFYFLLLICFISTWVFVRIEFSADDPLLPMDLFKLNNFSAYVFIGFLSGVILLSTLTFTPVFLQMAKGYSPTSSGMQILPLTVGIIASTSTCGIIMSKTGKYKLLPTFGSIFLIVGLFWMSRMNAETNGVTIGLILLLIGIGLGPQLSVITTAVQNTVNINQIGAATAALTMFRQIGSTFGVAFFSAIF